MDRYAFDQELGRGGFGGVYMARVRNIGKQVAIKKVRAQMLSETSRKKAQAEAEILKSLEHCNIVAYVDAFEDKHHLYIVMEYCDGGDLHSYLAQKNNELMPEAEILMLFVQICIAVEYVHMKKILHRDIKPRNILITRKGILKLGDFGISKQLNSSLELALTAVGTPCYASPERWRAMRYSWTSDIWSLGCVLHEMTTLKPLFQELNRKVLRGMITSGKYAPVPQKLSEDLRNLIRQMLKQDARERPSATTIRKTQVIQRQLEKYLAEVKDDDEDHVKLRVVLRRALVPSSAINANRGSPTPHAHAPAVNSDRPSACQQRLTPKSPYESKLPRQGSAARDPFTRLMSQKPPKSRSQENRQQHRLANVAARHAIGRALTTDLKKRYRDDQCSISQKTEKRLSSLPRLPRSLSRDGHASKNNSPEEHSNFSEVGVHVAPTAKSSGSDGSSSVPGKQAAARGEGTEVNSQNQGACCRTRVAAAVFDGLSAGSYDICNPALLRSCSLPSLGHFPKELIEAAGSTNEALGKAHSAADLTCDRVTTDADSRGERSMHGYWGTANHLDGCDPGESRDENRLSASRFIKDDGSNPSTSVADGSYNNCISSEPRRPSTAAIDDILGYEDTTSGTPRDVVTVSDWDSEAVDGDEILAVKEFRNTLEQELGASTLNRSYSLILRIFEDNNGNMVECMSAVEQILGPDRMHLREKLFELVIADMSLSQEYEQEGQQPTATSNG